MSFNSHLTVPVKEALFKTILSDLNEFLSWESKETQKIQLILLRLVSESYVSCPFSPKN